MHDLNAQAEDYAVKWVDRLLSQAVASGASDVHVEQLPGRVKVRMRIAGNLVDVGEYKDGEHVSLLGRIKALARLVTYRRDIPQEGRLVLVDQHVEARVGTLPTLHGERAVVRLAHAAASHWLPEQLGLPDQIVTGLLTASERPSGVLLVTGPAGAGKTTTAYSVVRHILHSAKQPRCIVTLEDPVEAELAGISQSQINPSAGYNWSEGLKALLRQDPEVMLVGEIRDVETATVVFQAAMTGQLVVTTMHARSSADAVRRLLDMQVPSHHLRSGLELLMNQRLVKRNCGCRAETATHPEAECSRCHGSGYFGRQLLAERFPEIAGELAKAVMQDADTGTINQLAIEQGMYSLQRLGRQMVEDGKLDAIELDRYL